MRFIAQFMRRHVWAGWILSAPVWYFALVWAFDRRPPFEVLHVVPAKARAGEYIVLQAHVRRDLDRECDAWFTRTLTDSQSVRFDLEGAQHAPSDVITSMNTQTPGKLILSVRLPETMASGPAFMRTSISYRCNVLHLLYPIQVQTVMPFEVLP